MTLCRQLQPYLDGRLKPEAAEAYRAHLSGCAACRARTEKWSGVETMIDQWRPPDAFNGPTENEVQHLMDEMREESTDTAKTRAGSIKAILALAALVAVVIVVRSLSQTASLPVAEPSVRLTDVRLFAQGSSAPQDQPIPKSNVLVSPKNGRLLARIGPSQIGLAPNSRVRLSLDDINEVRVFLQQGEIACDVNPADKTDFVIQAGTRSVWVVGTRFSVAWTPYSDRFVVRVVRGEVEIRDPSGINRRVTGGETYEAAAPGEVEARDDPGVDGVDALLRPPPAPSVQPSLKTIDPTLDRAPAVPSDNSLAPPTAKHRTARSKRDRHNSAGAPPAPQPTDRQIEQWRRLIIDGRYQVAIEAISTHLATHPRDGGAWALRADSERKSGQWQEAVRSYEMAARWAPPSSANRARFMAATIVQDKLDDPRRATVLLTAFLDGSKSKTHLMESAMLRLARAQLAIGDIRAARRLLHTLIDQSTSDRLVQRARTMLSSIDG